MKDQHPIGKISRRDLLRAGSSGLGLLALGSMLQLRLADRARGAPVPGLKRLVIVNLEGGNDGLNTLVPLQLGRYYDRRPGIAIAPSIALPLTGGPGTSAYGLHPKLPALQSLWNAGKVAFINKVGYPRPDLSHFTSEDIWSYGMRLPNGTDPSGWIARFADRYTSSALGVVSVGMGWRKDFSGGRVRPFVIDHLDRFQLDVDSKYALNHTLRVAAVRRLLELATDRGWQGKAREVGEQALAAVDQLQAAVESYASDVRYENDFFSPRMRNIAILIQGGLETQLFYTGLGNFDSHAGQAGVQDWLLGRLDAGIGSLVQDLQAMRAWRDTVIVLISEFGRNTFENGSSGTDHGAGNCLVVLGGRVKGGVYGVDLTNADIDRPYLDYEIDFRTVYSELLERHLGVDPGPIFPEPPEKTRSPGLFL